MAADPYGTERAPIPTLLRRARRAYAGAIQGALADAGCDDVPRNGAFVLAATAATGAQLGHIISELRVSKQAAGQLIDTLVSRGYLDRSVDPADRRRLTITLTDRGLGAAAVIRVAISSVDARLATLVSAEDIEAARRVLSVLVELELAPGPPDDNDTHNPERDPAGHGLPHDHGHGHPHGHDHDHGHGDGHEPGHADLAELAGPRLARTGLDRLGEHLAAAYGITVTGLAELDLGVYRVDRAQGGSWVARVFPAVRAPGGAAGDRDVLRFAEAAGYPAERCATQEPVSVLDGQDVLVTDFVPGVRGQQRRDLVRAQGGMARLGDLLGWLHTLPGTASAAIREGGAWHHLADGGPAAELAAARAQLAAAAGRVPRGQEHLHAALLAELDGLDDGASLPEALVHPDFVLANVIASPERGLVLVDWTGAGRGPRLWPLAFLLYSVGAQDLGRVGRVLASYLRRVRLEPEELARLAAVARARPVVLQSWLFCAGRRDLPAATAAVAEASNLADAVAARARAVMGA